MQTVILVVLGALPEHVAAAGRVFVVDFLSCSFKS